MAEMEFLKQNKLNTTTMIVVPAANTGTVAYSFDRNTGVGFTSSGYDSNTACVLSIVFQEPTVLSHVLIQNHNLRDFRVYYNSVTANSLGVVSSNSATSTYLSFSSVTVSSVDIQMDAAQTASREKNFGELVLTERLIQFERNPSAQDFDPKKQREKITHRMPDGGKIHYVVRDKFRASLKWKFITSTFKAGLETIFNDALAFYFLPFPTTTGWAGDGFEVLWDNDFDFTHSENSKTQGFEGKIELWETSNT